MADLIVENDMQGTAHAVALKLTEVDISADALSANAASPESGSAMPSRR